MLKSARAGQTTQSLNNKIGQAVSVGGNGSGWDIDDDFTSYANDTAFNVVYPRTDTTYNQGNASSDRLDYSTVANTTVKSLARDYGSTISDTNWITRFRWNITVKTLNSSGFDITESIGWSSADYTVSVSTNQDGIGIISYQDNLNRNYYDFYADNVQFNGMIGMAGGNFGTKFDTVGSVDQNYYVQQVRDSATQITTGLYSDEYSTLVEQEITTIPSTVSNLRYFSMKGNDWGTSSGGAQDGYVHTYLRFADGVSVPP